MKTPKVNLRMYVLAVVLVTFLSLGLYFSFNSSSDEVGVPSEKSLDVALDSVEETSASGVEGFFSIGNPLAWFMFGAWFALLLFFVLSLFSGHARR